MSLLCGLKTSCIFPSVLWDGLGGDCMCWEKEEPHREFSPVFEASTLWTLSRILTS